MFNLITVDIVCNYRNEATHINIGPSSTGTSRCSQQETEKITELKWRLAASEEERAAAQRFRGEHEFGSPREPDPNQTGPI